MKGVYYFFGFVTVVSAKLTIPDSDGNINGKRPKFSDPDPWWCITEEVPQYFLYPTPTSTLSDAIMSYGASLYSACTPSPSKSCKVVSDSWCAVESALPGDMRMSYSSYISSASSWWSEHREKASSVAEMCPESWYLAASDFLAASWFNMTLTFAKCAAKEITTTELPQATASSTASSRAQSGSQVTTSMPGETKKNAAGRVELDFQIIHKWMVMGTGLAITVLGEFL